VHNVLKKLDTGKMYICPLHLQNIATPWEIQKSDFQLYSTVISIKQLSFNHFNHLHGIYHFKTVNYGTLLAHIAVSDQNDLNLLKYLCQRWTAFQQHIVDELIEW